MLGIRNATCGLHDRLFETWDSTVDHPAGIRNVAITPSDRQDIYETAAFRVEAHLALRVLLLLIQPYGTFATAAGVGQARMGVTSDIQSITHPCCRYLLGLKCKGTYCTARQCRSITAGPNPNPHARSNSISSYRVLLLRSQYASLIECTLTEKTRDHRP